MSCYYPKPEPCRVCGLAPLFVVWVWLANGEDRAERRFYCAAHLPKEKEADLRDALVRVGKHWHLVGGRAEQAYSRRDCAGCIREMRRAADRLHRKEKHAEPMGACSRCLSPAFDAFMALEKEYTERLRAILAVIEEVRRLQLN
jgi:hypothetical protein